MASEFWAYIKEQDLASAWIQLSSLKDINTFDEVTGDSCLQVVAQNGEVALSMMLYMKGANVKWVNNDEETVLHSAAYSGNYQLCCFFLKAGADPQAVDRFGKYPFDNVPEEATYTKTLLGIGKTHRHVAKDLACTLSSKHAPTESHYKQLRKMEALIAKQHETVSKLDEEINNLRAAAGTLKPKEYKKTLERLQRKRDQLDNEFEMVVGTIKPRVYKKRKLSWLSLFAVKIL